MGKHEEWMQDPEYARLYAQEDLIQSTFERVLEWMERMAVDRAELARRIGTSRSYITQLLSGSRNITLKTLSDICGAIDVKPVFDLRPVLKVVYSGSVAAEIGCPEEPSAKSGAIIWKFTPSPTGRVKTGGVLMASESLG